LTLTSSALQALAAFIGRHCGTGWREYGLAEPVLEEIARSWKNRNGGVIVGGEGEDLKDILKNLEGAMSGGRIIAPRELSRQNSLMLGSSQEGDVSDARLGIRPAVLGREDSQPSFGGLDLNVDFDTDGDWVKCPRKWLKVIDAFGQPRHVYNVGKKHFDRLVPVCSFKRRANFRPGKLQNHHCFPKPRKKLKSSAIDIISSINAFFETNPSKRPHFQKAQNPPSWDNQPPA
jgi:hypothetical protein